MQCFFTTTEGKARITTIGVGKWRCAVSMGPAVCVGIVLVRLRSHIFPSF
jgi:hypothetical protein